MDPQTATALFDRGAFFVFADAPVPNAAARSPITRRPGAAPAPAPAARWPGCAPPGNRARPEAGDPPAERENEAAAGAPPALSFGIDLHTWTAGEKFMGMKLVPPGLHCVHYSFSDSYGGEGPRAGFWHFFAEREVVVKKWDPHAENWFPDSQVGEDERERYRSNLRDIDRRLGPYPLTAETSTYERWKALTSFVTPGVLKTVLPAGGLLTSATCPEPEPGTDGVVPGPERNAIPAARQQGAPGTHSAFPAQTIPSVTAHFADFDLRKSFPKGAAPELITKYSMDKSWLLDDVIARHFGGDYRKLLAELQLAFLFILLLHNFYGLEHWKKVITLICESREALLRRQSERMMCDFINVLLSQIAECPRDFLLSVVTEDNFLGTTLKSLMRAFRTAPCSEPGELSEARKRLKSLRAYVCKEFRWDIGDSEPGPAVCEISAPTGGARYLDDDGEEEEGEYAPVIVEE